MAGKVDQDLSSFMCILIMTIGCLVILLVVNVLVIISNPENVQLTTVIKAAFDGTDDSGGKGAVGVPYFGNKSKEPSYIDVHNDFIVLYPGEIRLPADQLETPDNALEQMLARIEGNKEREYLILLLRPRSSTMGQRLRNIILERGIDIGQELFEAGRKVNYSQTAL